MGDRLRRVVLCDICGRRIERWTDLVVVVPHAWGSEWRVAHDVCIDESDWSRHTVVEGRRCRDRVQALCWTLVLQRKRWYCPERWRTVLERLFTLPWGRHWF